MIIANPDQVSRLFHFILLKKLILIFTFLLALQEITSKSSNQIVLNKASKFNNDDNGTFKRASQSMYKIISHHL